MFTKVVLASLATVVLAQTSSNICNNPVSISSSADAELISSCTRLAKDVTIAASDDYQDIELPNVRSIGGDLTINGNRITTINMPQLNAVGGTWSMNNLTRIQTVTVTSLTSVGNINWQVLGPLLTSVTFGSGLTSCGDLNITNTQLQSLDGIKLTTVNHIDVENNIYLKTFNMPLNHSLGGIIIAANGAGQLNVALPNLAYSVGASFRDCGNVSIPNVERINGSLELNENQFSSFEAPKLTTIDEALAFVNNPSLTSFQLPAVTEVGGGVLVANNTDLENVDGLPKLIRVVGSMNFQGTFTNASFPALKDVEGTFNFQSSNAFDCDTINGYQGAQVKGNVTCSGNNPNPETNSSSSSGSGSSGSGGGSSGGKKNAGTTISINKIGMAVAAVFLGALAL